MMNTLNSISRRRMLYLPALALPASLVSSSGDGPASVNESSPSRSMYCSWVSHAWEGAGELQTLANLEFFRWLRDEYGMELDLYLLDAGNIDTRNQYGSIESADFRSRFPGGFGASARKAQSFGCSLGMWLGPDGFGDTPEQERQRAEMFVGLVRDHHFQLFKIDRAGGPLRPGKDAALTRLLRECRRLSPGLIVLNHRADLGSATSLTTTFLWEGRETYIDVHTANEIAAPHHRAAALSRGLPPNLTRLAEDCGVCLSSYLDFWDDDLVLQAFNRSLILAPEIYGNPWLLRDEEFPKLARLFNLHRRVRHLLVRGMVLPETRYGPAAVSRGDSRSRILTLRNLTWNPVTYSVRLDETIGLTDGAEVEVRQFHPSEEILGRFARGATVPVDVLPFRSCLLMASSVPSSESGVAGCPYEVVCDTPGKPVRLKLLGMPGTTAQVKLVSPRRFSHSTIDGLAAGRIVSVEFPGKKLRRPWHRKLGDLRPCAVPRDAEALYEGTCFAADNNALEVRSLQRSGPTALSAVQSARDAFFGGRLFGDIGGWDRFMFDGDPSTAFKARLRGGALRLDLGRPVRFDRLDIRCSRTDILACDCSEDRKSWFPATHEASREGYVVGIPGGRSARYLRIDPSPAEVSAISAHCGATALEPTDWRASNLFASFAKWPVRAAWSLSLTIDEATRTSYLAVAIQGRHGKEGAFAALRAGGEYLGAPDRCLCYPSNVWEYPNAESDRNYTYYFPVPPDLVGRPVDIYVLANSASELHPEAWITAYPIPYESRELWLE